MRQVRAFSPKPGAWFEVLGERIKVLHADEVESAGDRDLVLDDRLTIGCATGAVRPTLVQRAGGRPMLTADFLRGFPIPAGTRL